MAGQHFQFPPFIIADTQSAGPRWKKWLARFDNYLIAMDITAATRKKALLVHFAGESVADIYDTLISESDDYAATKTKLTNYFAPQVNLHYEIYMFRNAKQEDSETVDQFCTRLRALAATCEFADIDRELLSQIIQNCQSQELRRRALRKTDIKLNELLVLARTLEASDFQAMVISKSTEQAAINMTSTTKYAKTQQTQHYANTHKCWNCGGKWPHRGGRQACPAYGKICANCSKQNHFAQHCRSTQGQSNSRRTINTIVDTTQFIDAGNPDSVPEDNDNDTYVFTIHC